MTRPSLDTPAARALALAAELNEFALRLAGDQDPEAVAATAIEATRRVLGGGDGALWILDADKAEFFRAGTGPGAEIGAVPYTDASPLGSAVLSGKAVFLENAAEYASRFRSSWERIQASPSTGDRAIASVSASAGGAQAGLVIWFAGPRRFDENERALLVTLGKLCGHALERISLLRRLTAEARRAELAAARSDRLHQLAAELALVDDQDQACRVLVDHLRPALSASSCIVALPEAGSRLRIRASFGVAAAVLESLSVFAFDAPLAPAAAFVTRAPVWLASEQDFAAFEGNRWTAQHNNNRAGAGIPLVLHGECLGAIGIGYTTAHRFSEDDKQFAAALAAQGAQVLGRLRLRESEQRSRAKLDEAMHGLEQQRQRLARLVEEMPVGVVVADPQGEVTLGNHETGRVWGLPDFPLDRATRMRVLRAYREDGTPLPPDQWPFARTLATGQRTQAELRILRPDGSEGWLLMNAGPLVDSSGALESVVVTAQDITPIKLAQQEAARARATAEEANRTKDEFLAMLGHELRNPLAPIVTSLHLMKLRAGGALEHERSVIERQVTHLSRLVDDLLDVSRITRGKVELVRRPTEVAEIVAKALELTRPLFGARHQRLEVSVDNQDLVIEGDPVRLAQVLSNLLANASKYNREGGQASLSVHREGEQAVFVVRDDGVGISAEVLPRVFEPFVQAPQSIDRAEGGLGLGLAIVQNLVRLHGGTVSAHSEGLGRGAEFRVHLPLANTLVQVDAATASPPPKEEAAHGLRVLVVDDNVDAAELLAEALLMMGHSPEVVFDGEAALEAAARGTPDVVLLDIGLPGIDGYEVARRLQATPTSPKPVLVALTGYGQASDHGRSREVGFAHHLVKPVDLEVLRRLIAEAVPR